MRGEVLSALRVVYAPDMMCVLNDRPQENQLEYFVFMAAIRSDPAAQSSRPAPTGYLHPAGDCSVVRKGVEPARCRGTDGECKACSP